MAFLFVGGSLALGHQCFRTGGLFCFSGINYTTESIWGNGSVGISKGHHATPIGKMYISAPGIGNEYIMLSERSWCGVSPPLRSGKHTPTNGINIFFWNLWLSHGHSYAIPWVGFQGLCCYTGLCGLFSIRLS